MQITDPQWQELQEIVQSDDRGRAERLLDAMFLKTRRAERASLERTKRVQRQAARQWIPEQV